MPQEVNAKINTNFKASGLNEIENQVDEIFDKFDKELDIELNPELDENSMDDVVDSIKNTKADIEVGTDFDISEIESKLEQAFNSIDIDKTLELDTNSQIEYLNNIEKLEEEYKGLLDKIETFKNNGDISFQNVQGSLQLFTNRVNDLNSKLGKSVQEYNKYLNSYRDTIEKLQITEGLMTDEEEERLNTLKEARRVEEIIARNREKLQKQKELDDLAKEFELLEKIDREKEEASYTDVERINNEIKALDELDKRLDESLNEHNYTLSDDAEKALDSLHSFSLAEEEATKSSDIFSKKGLETLAKEFRLLDIKIPGTNKGMAELVRLFKQGGVSAGIIGGSLALVVGILTTYTKLLNNAIKATTNFVKVLGSKAWNSITTGFTSMINGLKSGINTISSLFNQVVNYVVQSADLSNIAGVATSLGDDMVNALKGDVQESSLLYQIMTDNQRKALLGLENETQRYNYLVSQSGSLQAQYAAYLNTTNGRLLSMRSAFSGVSQTITAFARNVLAVLAPVLTTIANFVNGILQVLGKLLHFDMSGASKIGSIGGSLSDGFNQAKKAAEDYQKSASKSTKKAAKDTKKAAKDISKAIEEAKRQTLSFDDVIQISDTNKDVSDIDVLDDLDDLDLDNIAGGVGDVADALADLGGSLDLPGMELPKWLQDLLDLLSNKEFFKFGAGLADALADILRKVPWDEIREKAESLGKGLAEFFNGVFSSKSNWETFGYSLAQVFNTIASALKGFLDEFNFKQAGTSIGAFFAKMFDSVDTETVGHDIYKIISGAFEFAVNFLAENHVLKGLNMIARIISQAFSEWTEEDTQNVANSLVMFIQQALRGITNIIGSIDFSVVNNIITAFFDNMQAYLDDTGKGDIKRLLNTVVNGISELLGDGSLAEKIIGVANTLLDTITEWLDNGGDDKIAKIGDAIVSFLDKLRSSGIIQRIGDLVRRLLSDIQWTSILQDVIGLQLDIWLEGIKTKIDTWFGTLFGGTTEHLQELWTLLSALWMTGAILLANWLIGVENDIKTWWDGLVTGIGTWFNQLFTDIGTWWSGFTSDVKTGFNSFISGILQTIENIVRSIASKVQTGLESVYNVIKGIWDKIKGIFDNITSGIDKVKEKWNNSKVGQMVSNLNIWPHATGGITNGPSIGLVGEAGREAILPLENNTGWMDILANKISGINGGGGNTQNITIDFSSLNKPFYSRAELIEMGQIINDSLNAYNFGTT